MDKWAYCWVFIYIGELTTAKKMNKVEEKFNKLGAEGWELVGIFDSHAWFKRKIEGD